MQGSCTATLVFVHNENNRWVVRFHGHMGQPSHSVLAPNIKKQATILAAAGVTGMRGVHVLRAMQLNETPAESGSLQGKMVTARDMGNAARRARAHKVKQQGSRKFANVRFSMLCVRALLGCLNLHPQLISLCRCARFAFRSSFSLTPTFEGK